MRPSRPAAILLDFYGTVVEEDGLVISRICSRIAADTGLENSSSEIGQLWWSAFTHLLDTSHGTSFRTQREIELESLHTVTEYFGSKLDAEQLSAELFSYWRRPPLFADGARLLRMPGLPPVCVVSNIDRPDIESAIAHHALPITALVTSEDARGYKPRPEIFRQALELLDLEPEHVLHVGDSLSSDVAGARAAGIRAVWVNRSGRPKPAGLEPWAIITSLDGLLPLLERTSSS